MAYCTTDDVKLILKGTTGDLPAAADKLEVAQLDQAVVDAQVEVDLALSNFYITPLDPVPETIKYITMDIAAYMADLTFRMSKEYGPNPNPLRLRYTRARSFLDGLISGKYLLDVPDNMIRGGTSAVFNPYEGDIITVEHLFGAAVYG